MPEELAGVEQTATGSAGSSHDVSLNEPADSSSSLSPAIDSGGNGEKQPVQGSAKEKKPSVYYQIRQAKKAFKAEQEAFTQQREAFARERAEFEQAKKPKRDYSLEDLRKYRPQWARELQKAEDTADYEAVDSLRATIAAADKEIAAMEVEARTNSQSDKFKAEWETAERELAQADPEFLRNGTRLDAKLREIMGSADGNIYRQHPRGIVAAYHRAKMELMEGDFKVLQTENSKLKNELQRYTGLTSIGGGAPARLGGSNRVESIEDFSRLSLADMQKHLKRGAKRDGVPWF